MRTFPTTGQQMSPSVYPHHVFMVDAGLPRNHTSSFEAAFNKEFSVAHITVLGFVSLTQTDFFQCINQTLKKKNFSGLCEHFLSLSLLQVDVQFLLYLIVKIRRFGNP